MGDKNAPEQDLVLKTVLYRIVKNDKMNKSGTVYEKRTTPLEPESLTGQASDEARIVSSWLKNDKMIESGTIFKRGAL